MADYYNLGISGESLNRLLNQYSDLNTNLESSIKYVSQIKTYIPTGVSEDNRLVTQSEVNSEINTYASYYITAASTGGNFDSANQLETGPWYSAGQERTPTKNDYALVEYEVEDESGTLIYYDKYYCTGLNDQKPRWQFQYSINASTFTAAQIAAMDSGITKDAVGTVVGEAQIINSSGYYGFLPVERQMPEEAGVDYAYVEREDNDGSASKLLLVEVSVDPTPGSIVRRDSENRCYANCKRSTTSDNLDPTTLINYEFLSPKVISADGYPNEKGNYNGQFAFVGNDIYVCIDLTKTGSDGWRKLKIDSSTSTQVNGG